MEFEEEYWDCWAESWLKIAVSLADLVGVLTVPVMLLASNAISALFVHAVLGVCTVASCLSRDMPRLTPGHSSHS